jgi:hypothetical protein
VELANFSEVTDLQNCAKLDASRFSILASF